MTAEMNEVRWGFEPGFQSVRPTCKAISCAAEADCGDYCEPHAAEIAAFRDIIAEQAAESSRARHRDNQAAAQRDERPPDESWKRRAACRGLDPDIFFPERGELTSPAKRVCADCPVVDECREYAVSFYERFGVWGGLSEKQRRQIRRRRAINRHRTQLGQQTLLLEDVPSCAAQQTLLLKDVPA